MRFSPLNTYPANDGSVALGAATREDWIALLEVMERTDLLGSEDYMNAGWRVAHNSEVDEVVTTWTAPLSCDDILKKLNTRDVPCSQIRNIEDVVAWPHLKERGILQALKHPGFPDLKGPLAPAFPLKFTQADTAYEQPVPVSGQHNGEIYGDLLGMSDDELEALMIDGVI